MRQASYYFQMQDNIKTRLWSSAKHNRFIQDQKHHVTKEKNSVITVHFVNMENKMQVSIKYVFNSNNPLQIITGNIRQISTRVIKFPENYINL